MHVDPVEFDGFKPITPPGPEEAVAGIEGPRPGTVSLVARDGRLRVSLTTGPMGPRRGLIAAIRQLLRMPEHRGGAEPLTFARVLRLRGLGQARER